MEEVESTQPDGQASLDSSNESPVADSTQDNNAPVATNEESLNDNVEQSESAENQEKSNPFFNDKNGKYSMEKELSYSKEFVPKYQDELRQRKELESKFQDYETLKNEHVQLSEIANHPAVQEALRNAEKLQKQEEYQIELPEKAFAKISATEEAAYNAQQEVQQLKAQLAQIEMADAVKNQISEIKSFSKNHGIELTDADAGSLLQTAQEEGWSASELKSRFVSSESTQKKMADFYMKKGKEDALLQQQKSQNGSLSAGSERGVQDKGLDNLQGSALWSALSNKMKSKTGTY